MTKLRITHIDNGVAPATLDDITGTPQDDPLSGRWPKVSFNDGMTLSYQFVTNTKIIFFTGNNKQVIANQKYNDLILAFFASDRDFNESNWRTQKRRVSNWHPIDVTKENVLA